MDHFNYTSVHSMVLTSLIYWSWSLLLIKKILFYVPSSRIIDYWLYFEHRHLSNLFQDDMDRMFSFVSMWNNHPTFSLIERRNSRRNLTSCMGPCSLMIDDIFKLLNTFTTHSHLLFTLPDMAWFIIRLVTVRRK